MVKTWLKALRVKQWTKNSLLFLGLVFSLQFTHPDKVLTSLVAFGLFCLVSSGGYLINDVIDCEHDRQHPTKCNRPIACGAINRNAALAVAAVLLAVGLAGSFAVNLAFGAVALAYVAISVGYTVGLKHVVIIDVLSIAAGFVLRAVGGAAALAVPISPWLYVCTILGALFLGIAKRRHELVLLEDDARNHRGILEHYSPDLLDQMSTIVTASLVMAYSLYTFTAENLPKNQAMMLTIPFVLYGIFRYLYLVHRKNAGGTPEEVLLQDVPIMLDIVLWVTASAAILYFFRG